MRVLILDEEIPYPTNTGKKTRSFNLITRLSQKHQIDYLCYVDPDKETDLIAKFQEYNVKVYPVFRKKPSKVGLDFYIRLFFNIFSLLPFIVSEYHTSSYRNRMATLLSLNDYDLIHCEISPYAIFLSNQLGIPSVGVSHNIEAEIWHRYLMNESNPFRKLYILLQWKKIASFESKYLQNLKICVAVSERDSRYLMQEYNVRKVATVSNGVDIDYFYPKETDIIRNNLVFSGSMDWRPNQDAVKYFIENIWHLIQKQLSDVSFTVVGREPPLWLKELVRNVMNMELTGTVDDVRPYINRAHLYIVPLRIGGGSRLKILEAMASGKAVISTSTGAEGLDIADGKNIFIEDSPNGFANRVVELLQKDKTREKLEQNGRKLVERKYQWDILADKMDHIWKRQAGRDKRKNAFSHKEIL